MSDNDYTMLNAAQVLKSLADAICYGLTDASVTKQPHYDGKPDATKFYVSFEVSDGTREDNKED